jgi:high-affinity Fe2+/Pb2+ permease
MKDIFVSISQLGHYMGKESWNEAILVIGILVGMFITLVGIGVHGILGFVIAGVGLLIIALSLVGLGVHTILDALKRLWNWLQDLFALLFDVWFQ